MEYSFTILGRPVPYKRTTQRQKWVDKSYHKYRDYKQVVRDSILSALSEPLGASVVSVSVNVYLSGGGANGMGRDGDIDNYIKTALDSMNKVVFDDDRQVVSVTGRKESCEFGQDRMTIRVWEANDGQE